MALSLRAIIEDKDYKSEIEALDLFLLLYSKPSSFTGKASLEIDYDKKFEQTRILISEKLKLDSEKMSVLQFYSAKDYLKKQFKDHGRKSDKV